MGRVVAPGNLLVPVGDRDRRRNEERNEKRDHR
jgi:hypothetical protein